MSSYYFEQYCSPVVRCQPMEHNGLNIKADFPIFQRKVNGHPLIWLDNGATTQKPYSVINAISNYYSNTNSNIHRGAHTLAKISTESYESARNKVENYIGASSPEEIIFVRGATEAINLIAETYGESNIKSGDEILLTTMEHHSNIVPWQMLSTKKGAHLKAIPINDCGDVDLDGYKNLLSTKTKIVCITHVSNVLGTINPLKQMIKMAHSAGAIVVIDGAQSAAHIPVNVKELDADFFVLSGHKAYAPTGIGVVYGKKEILENMPPWQKGGGMIKNVSFEKTEFNHLPEKYEAGTPNIAGAIGLGTAIDYINSIGLNHIYEHEQALTKYGMEALAEIPRLKLIGHSADKISVLSFVLDNLQPTIVANRLNQYGIATRAGHHCAQPTLKHYGLTACNRASLGVYNTKEDIDALVRVLYLIDK